MKACFHVPRLYRQQGAVLFICLVFLLIITMIGVIASQTMVLEEKMVGNLSANSMAFAGAEAGLRNCERRLRILPSLPKPRVEQAASNPWVWALNDPDPNAGNPGFNPNNFPPWWVSRESNPAWWQANGGGQGGSGTSHSYNLPNNLNGLQQSSCVIEYLGQQPEPLNQGTGKQQHIMYYYRITARSSTGNNNNTVVILQSVFDWEYGPN